MAGPDSPPNPVDDEQPAFFGRGGYLDVNYSLTRKPRGDYPVLLARRVQQIAYGGGTGRLLDLGCGRGDNVDAFAKLGFDVAGVDLSPRAPDYSPGYDVRVADLERDELPFADQTFDFLFSKSVIEHARRPDLVLERGFRALRPGGKAAILTPSYPHTHWGPYHMSQGHVTPFTKVNLRDLLSIVGFEVDRVEHLYQLPFLWRYPWLKPAVRAGALLRIPYRPYHEGAPWPKRVNTLIRFSTEVMLLAVARKPDA